VDGICQFECSGHGGCRSGSCGRGGVWLQGRIGWVWAARAGDGGWSGSQEGQRRPVALRPPVDGGLVGNRGDLLPAVATLRRAATPYGARIADAAVAAPFGGTTRFQVAGNTLGRRS
jgi:hypothetical protein